MMTAIIYDLGVECNVGEQSGREVGFRIQGQLSDREGVRTARVT